MQFSTESLEKLREIFKEDFKADLTDQELHEAAFNLVGFFDTLMKCAHKDVLNYLRLEKEPGGYQPEEGTYKCRLCGYDTLAGDCWTDRNGPKCRLCQGAINDGIIPGSVCLNKEKKFSFEDLRDKFGIHHTTARSLVRKGELKAREVKNDSGKTHFMVFLREDNYQFLKIDKEAPESNQEDYDKQVAEWAERYKQKMKERDERFTDPKS